MCNTVQSNSSQFKCHQEQRDSRHFYLKLFIYQIMTDLWYMIYGMIYDLWYKGAESSSMYKYVYPINN